jgi:hypothetical protein
MAPQAEDVDKSRICGMMVKLLRQPTVSVKINARKRAQMGKYETKFGENDG